MLEVLYQQTANINNNNGLIYYFSNNSNSKIAEWKFFTTKKAVLVNSDRIHRIKSLRIRNLFRTMNSNLSTSGSYLFVAKNVRYEKCLCCRITNSNLSTSGSYLFVAKNVRYEKCLCCRITTAIHTIQSLCILVLQ
uniref:Uncharacterized protein n=1 Tax=Wuchereria bancrofti TaxID=6293 RepID=A0AAF5Q3W9_WUCBA